MIHFSKSPYFYIVAIVCICSLTISIENLQAQTFELQLNPHVYTSGYNISCNGLSDGSIDLVVFGGTPPFVFQWSNGATSQDIGNLTGGIYSVTVTDAYGLTITASRTLNEPQVLATSVIVHHVTINGESNGSIFQETGGGTPPYSYLWNNGSVSSTLKDITAGNYSVSVTDANGCTTSISVNVTQPDPLIITSFIGTNVSCPRGVNGSIDVSVIGGIPPYTYAWSNGAFTQDIFDLPAGEYTLRITDQGGATVENTISIQEPDELEIVLTSPLYPNGYQISCNECFNGSVNSTVQGGTAPYIYSWSDQTGVIAATPAISGLGENKYVLTVTDQSGCISSNAIELREAPLQGWKRSGNAGTNSSIEFIGTTDAEDLSFRTNNTERLRIKENGDVEITSFTGTNSGLLYTDTTGTLRIRQVEISSPLVCNGPTVLPWITGADAGTDVVNCWQEFGIGTDAPQSKLEVKGDVRITSSTGSGNYLNLLHDGSSMRIDNFGNGPLLINYGDAFNPGLKDVKICTGISGNVTLGGNNYLAFDPSKKVGIGTETPNYKLDVVGEINAQDFKINGNSISGGLWQQSVSGTGIFYNSGNVGVNATNPEAKFQVNDGPLTFSAGATEGGATLGWGTSYIGFNAVKTGSTLWKSFHDNQHNGGALVFGNIQGDIGFVTVPSCSPNCATDQTYTDQFVHDNIRMKIRGTDGNVAIGGDYETDYRLNVCGNIRATRVRVTSSWCDFVFDENYRLPELKEVATFIKDNKHLPGIPSEKEIVVKGLDLGEMVKMQMQKIEELYLYIIGQETKIKEMEGRLNNIQSDRNIHGSR